MSDNLEDLNKVTFLNEPKLSEHEADAKFNERRTTLLPTLKDFINKHPLFEDKKVEATFLHAGVSSLVCIVDTADQKYVLKVPLSLLTSGLEGSFLKIWESTGVKVPHVFEEGILGGHFYVLMEYIETETLIQKYTNEELLQNNTYRDLGKVLRKMHTTKTKGYSNIVNDKKEPEYQTVAEWLEGDTRTKEQFAYVKENRLLSDTDHGSIEEACNIIISRIGESKETVYCHNDFHTGNIFATEPLTVFDPWACFHHPYMDIARSIILASKVGLDEVTKQFVEGYFEDEEYDQTLLQAFITINIWVKLPYIYKTKQTETMEDLRKYLNRLAVGN
jgi:fructosamine-3-kinase